MFKQLIGNSSSLQVLIVDNDQNTVTGCRKALEDRGFQVRTAVTAEQAIQQVKRFGPPNLMIVADQLELGTPADKLAQQVLQQYKNLPFIILFGTRDSKRAARYIDNWSDDCIVKPVNPAEVAVRTQRVLNRIANSHNNRQLITEADEHLTIDFSNRKAYLHNTSIKLTPIETNLLYILLHNNGNTVTKEFMIRRLWPDGQAPETRLYTSVSRLRKKLKVNSEVPNYIVLNPGIGYQFVRAEL